MKRMFRIRQEKQILLRNNVLYFAAAADSFR